MKFPRNDSLNLRKGRLSVVFGGVTQGMSSRTPFKLTKYLRATPIHYTVALRQHRTVLTQ